MTRLPLVLVAAAFLAGCPETYIEPTPPSTPDPEVGLEITTELEHAPTLRLQQLRSDVVLDCDLVPQLAGRMAPRELDVSLFDGGWTAELGRGKRVMVRHRPGATCDLVRIEMNGRVSMATLSRNYGTQVVMLTDAGLGGSSMLWPELEAGHDRNLERCAPDDLDPVRWSEPVPVGDNLRIDALERSGSCMRMQLSSSANPAAFQWEVCSGAAELPLAQGDAIDVGLSAAKAGVVQHPTVLIQRHPRRDEDALRIWLGEGPVVREGNDPSQPNVSVARDERCAVRTLECGMVTMPARVDVSVAQRGMQLRAGEHVRLVQGPGSFELSVGNAELVAIASSACTAPSAAPRFVAVDRRRERAPRIAADPANAATR